MNMEPAFDIEAYLESLPEDIIELNIQSRGLRDLPSLSRFKNLQYLNCSINELVELPPLPETLKALECYNNMLTSLPDLNILLERLDCSDNRISHLPHHLYKNINLRYLNCSENCISELPLLNQLNLHTLNFRQNNLSYYPMLPDCLRILYCGRNEFSELSYMPDNLRELFCESLEMEYLPDLPKTLTTLCCHNNKLSWLPTLHEGLKYVYCSENNLSYLPPPPESMISLICRDNPIHSVICRNLNDYNNFQEIKRGLQILDNAKELCHLLKVKHYAFAFKRQFRQWLWERVREPKIIEKYNPTNLFVGLIEEEDDDTTLEKILDNIDQSDVLK